MAQKLWTEAIDKNVDWSDVDGNGTPASGEVVQNFIKDTLQQKFGYLYQDRQNLTNYIFADKADYELWASDETTYSNLVLTKFKAPADAMIKNISALSSDVSVTTLLTSKNRIIKFNFYTEDSSGNAVMENTSMRMTITHGGVSQTTAVQTIEFDKTNWNNAEIGTHYDINVDEYLTEAGTYDFTIVLTGVGTQATTTLAYRYTVVSLDISIDNFDYSTAIDSNASSFTVPYTITGAAGIDKVLNFAIDGEYLDQSASGWPIVVSSGDTVSSRENFSDSLTLYIKNTDGETLTWTNPKDVTLKDKQIFSPGKHTLQINTSIAGSTVGESFYSQTKFVNFVVYDSESIEEFNYLLYSTTMEAGTFASASNEISLSENQYNALSLSVAVVNTRKSPVNLKYTISAASEDISDVEYNVSNLASGSVNKLDYTFNNAGDFTVNILASSANSTNTDTMDVKVTITPFSMTGETIEETTRSLYAKYDALNRSNTADNHAEWVNTSVMGSIDTYKFPAVFNKVYWNDQSGWDGKALILKNGATVTIPIDLFSSTLFDAAGLTFEIDFETFDVQSESALVLDYSDKSEANSSYIKITATSASAISKLTMRQALKTNFMDGTRNKIAFAFNPTTEIGSDGKAVGSSSENPNLVMIYVNGVLDRAAKWGTGSANSDTIVWNNPTTKSITIGNQDGACGVKIYGIRIYNRAINPEEAFMNYVSDQGSNIPTIMKKNHILEDGNVSFELCKQLIPTLVISTDFEQINNADYKKNNTQYEAQFFDPSDPTLNFYLRNGWISCQGTSSMNYPTKNLRPYLNKADRNKDKAKTLQYTISTNPELTAVLPSEVDPTSPSFNTEFWPVTEYEGHEDDVTTWLDNTGVLPYLVNKKEIVKSKEDGITLGLHEIGWNLSKAYKKKMAKMYAKGINEENFYQAPEPIYYLVSSGVYRIINPQPNEDGSPNPNSVNEQIDSIVDSGGSLYISAYRSLLRRGWTVDSDEYWEYIQQLRFSGYGLFTRSAKTEDDVPVLYTYKKAKALEKGKEYFGLGATWRQYDETGHHSGWADKWTLKADYAESSNTHNGGIGRLWGNAFRNAKYNGTAVGITAAQQAGLQNYGDIYIDIRTSCDCKPIVLFVKNPVGYDSESGKVLFGTPTFAGLYSIMTDKSSTALFGFENIKGPKNETLFDAKDVQCIEVSSNSTLIGQGLAVNHTGTGDVVTEGADIGKGREIWEDTNFEVRWPECGADSGEYDAVSNPRGTESDTRWNQDEGYGVPTDRFETLWNWVNFTKKAVNYTVSGHDGYSFSEYVKFDGDNDVEVLANAVKYKKENPDKHVYITFEASGNTQWAADNVDVDENKELFRFYPDYDPSDTSSEETQVMINLIGRDLYYYDYDIDVTNVKKTINDLKIGDDPDWASEVYKVQIPGFDATYRFTDPETGGWDEVRAQNFFVEVYMKKQNNRFYYKSDVTGDFVQYNGSVSVNDDDHLMKSSIDGLSFTNKTYMDFFKETKWDHLDVYKVAAYFIYVTRFGAVDQMVKNCMITTDDGQHWYYINYDNDTVLGVRNDAALVFNWDFTRDSYDWTNNSWAYQGVRSVLWNNLEADSEFMAIVAAMDNTFYTEGYLSTATVLEYLNDKGCDTWNERLYNAQEEIKYLSTFRNNFSTEKYLDFLQGNRKSHRIWWVTNRWELIDAQWGVGSYAQKKLRFYESIPNANDKNIVKYLNITSSSKYYYTMLMGSNDQIDYTELDANETYTFSTNKSISQNDPLALIGPHKIKILNFRPAANSFTSQAVFSETYTIINKGVSKTVSWIEDAGTTMTKLLIGNSVDVCPVSTIGGVGDIISLEELDLSGCSSVAAPAVTKLTNLRRFRANKSTVKSFEPAEGSTFYEISLPHDTTGDLSLLNLIMKDIRLEHQASSDYVVYQVDENGTPIEGSDALPYIDSVDENGVYHIESGVYTDNVFKYTAESGAIFDMVPTYKLSNVTLHNVEGLDTQSFVFDWYNAVTATQESISSKELSLQGIDWKDIKVSELIKLVKGYDILNLNDNGEPTKVSTFNIGDFAGTVSVISDEEGMGDTITLDEYNLIIKYFTEDVFVAGNELQIVTGANTFYQPTTDSRSVKTTIEGLTGQYNAEIPIYEVIRGDEFKVKATLFPVTTKKIVYVLTSITNSGPSRQNPSSDYTYADSFRAITLKTNASGLGVFNAEDTNIPASVEYALFAITLATVDENGSLEFAESDIYDVNKTIYVNAVNRVVPVANEINVKLDGVTKTSFDIRDSAEHTITFTMANTVNAPIKSITRTIGLDNSDYIIIDSEWTNPSNNVYEFTFHCNIPKATITNAVIPFNFTFNKVNGTATTTTIKKDISFTITPIYPESITVYSVDDENETELSGNKINLTCPGNNLYKIKISPENFNVDIQDLSFVKTSSVGQMYSSKYLEYVSPIKNEDGTYDFSINVKSNQINNSEFDSFACIDNLAITTSDKYGVNNLSSNITVETNIVYPKDMYIAIGEEIEEGVYSPYKVSTDDDTIDIYLTNNEAKNAKITFLPHDQQIGNNYFKPSVEYSISFNPIEMGWTTEGSNSVNNTNIGTYYSLTSVAGEANAYLLEIPAQNNQSFILTLNGSYKVSYDGDTTEDGELQVSTTNNFKINIVYSFADATSYQKLEIGEYYLVDESSNYYKIDISNTTDFNEKMFYINTFGINAIGFGKTILKGSTIFPYFMMFRYKSIDKFDKVVYENYKYSQDGLTSQTLYSSFVDFMPSTITNKTTSGYGWNDNETDIFFGYKITHDWIDPLEENTIGLEESRLYELLHMFDDNTRINAYIPSFQELNALLGNDDEFVNLADEVMKELCKIHAYDDILLFEETHVALIGAGSGNISELYNNISGDESIRSILLFVSNARKDNNTSYVTIFGKKYGVEYGSTFNNISSNIQISTSSPSAIQRATGILPFLKVS